MEDIYSKGDYVVFTRPYTANYNISDTREFKKGEKLKIIDKEDGVIYFQDGSYIAPFNKESIIKIFTDEIDALEFSEIMKESYKEPTVITVRNRAYSENDTVTFNIGGELYYYKITPTHLAYDTDMDPESDSDLDDDTIFWELDLSNNIISICERAYGYRNEGTPMDGIPRYRKYDYEAATRLVDEIKILCRNYNSKNEIRQQDETTKLVNIEDEISSYKQVYSYGSTVIFDVGSKSFTYQVGIMFLSCSEGWDAIYKAIGVDPEKFIEKATGKKAVKHAHFWGYKDIDAEASDRLIKALLFECASLKLSYYAKSHFSKILPVTKPQKNNVNLSVSFEDDLKYDKLEVFK